MKKRDVFAGTITGTSSAINGWLSRDFQSIVEPVRRTSNLKQFLAGYHLFSPVTRQTVSAALPSYLENSSVKYQLAARHTAFVGIRVIERVAGGLMGEMIEPKKSRFVYS